MAVDSVGQSGSTSNDPATTTTTKKGQELGKDAFLQLLVTQLTHQDPTQPQADGAFIAQLATFSQLESLQGMQSQLTKIGTALGVPADAADATNQA